MSAGSPAQARYRPGKAKWPPTPRSPGCTTSCRPCSGGVASICTGSSSAAPSTASPASAGRASATTPGRFASPTFGYARASGSPTSTTSSPPGASICGLSRSPARPGRAYPRCTGGRRAGPPEDWDGPWVLLERTQRHLVLGAAVRAAEIIGQLLDAGEHHDLADTGMVREELAGLAPCSAWSVLTAAPATRPSAALPWAWKPSLRGAGHEGQRAGDRTPRRRHRGLARGPAGAHLGPRRPGPGHPRPAARRGEGPGGGGTRRRGRAAGRGRDRQAGGLPALRRTAPAQRHPHDRGAQPVRRAAARQPPLVALAAAATSPP
jgi:hypothetical protein